MTIIGPFHSESQTVWYVLNGDQDCLATLKIGNLYRTDEGAMYKLLTVSPKYRVVSVERVGQPGTWYTWMIDSLINEHMTEIDQSVAGLTLGRRLYQTIEKGE